MPDPDAAPRTAREAAQALADDGHHSHLSTDGERLCISGHCHTDDG